MLCFGDTISLVGIGDCYEAQTLLKLDVSRRWTPTPTLMNTLNHVIFSNYYWCQCVSVSVYVRAYVHDTYIYKKQ
jgi:hypothetical protein